jgi:hypothetical protein
MKRVSSRSRNGASMDRALAKALDFECIRSASLSYDEVVRNFRKVERFYLKELRGDAKLSLETRRRIAEHLLTQALFHPCPQRICSSRLRATAKLGFENVEREAHFQLLYARGSLARGHGRIARKTAVEMTEKLRRSLRRRKSPLAKQCLTLFEGLLEYMESGAQVRQPSKS